MAARKTASESLAPKKPATAAAVRAAAKKAAPEKPVATAVDEAPEPLVGIPYDSLSPELKAILDEATELKEKEEREIQKRNSKILVYLLAQYKLMKETGHNALAAKDKLIALGEMETAGFDKYSAEEIGEIIYSVVVALAGEKMAAEFLKTVEDKTGFLPILRDVIRLAGVVKA